ncbi:MAG: AlpA family phage regulatory protein [Porticoccaceae bacterium]|nr:AlpA family phage regulatory protein [Porticoccaceae bacterium]
MIKKAVITIERKAEVLERIGLSRSTLHNKIQNGLWCPPVSLGARAVGFIKHETDELISAHINGYSQVQLRQLVSKLVSERKELLGVRNDSI